VPAPTTRCRASRRLTADARVELGQSIGTLEVHQISADFRRYDKLVAGSWPRASSISGASAGMRTSFETSSAIPSCSAATRRARTADTNASIAPMPTPIPGVRTSTGWSEPRSVWEAPSFGSRSSIPHSASRRCFLPWRVRSSSMLGWPGTNQHAQMEPRAGRRSGERPDADADLGRVPAPTPLRLRRR
jgi:hypothetical protein